MRKLSSWAARIALSAGATAGVVAACYSDVRDPVTPLPREVPPQGPRPEPILPTPLPPLDAGPGSADPVIEARAPLPAQDLDEDAGVDTDHDGGVDAGDGGVHDAGASDADVTDVVELPPVPDADVPLLPPGLPH